MEYRQNNAGRLPRSPRIESKNIGQDVDTKTIESLSEMEVAKPSAPPDLEVRFSSCNKSAIKRWLSLELEETVVSLTHELFMTKHYDCIVKQGS